MMCRVSYPPATEASKWAFVRTVIPKMLTARPAPTNNNEATKSSPKGSKPVTSTFTSLINGTPTVVTATSYVGVDAQGSATGTRPGGSLQTNAAVSPNQRGRLLDAVIGVVVGGAMLV